MLVQIKHRAKPDVLVKDFLHLFGFGHIDDQSTVAQVISKGYCPSHPHTFLLRSGDLIPDALPCYLPLKLSEGEKDVQSEPSHRCCGVELLCDGDEAHALFIEGFDDPRKIR
jgi:hypothetical protein